MEKESFVTLFARKVKELASAYSSRDKSLADNDFYAKHKVSDLAEEDFVTQELCEYIDTFYDKRSEYESSELSSDEWFENEVDRTVDELMPDATEEEREQFHRIIADGIDKQAEAQLEAVKYCLEDVVDKSSRKEDSNEG